MQNGEHITVLPNYLKSIAVIKMGYRMAATLFRINSYMNQIVKGIFMLLLLYFYHTNNTLKILFRCDLSYTDTLLNILKMEFNMAVL